MVLNLHAMNVVEAKVSAKHPESDVAQTIQLIFKSASGNSYVIEMAGPDIIHQFTESSVNLWKELVD